VACTSVVVESSGGPWLARTMDWTDARELKQLCLTIDVYQRKQPLYVGAFFPGVVGVLTGMRYGAFSVAINFRDAPPQGEEEHMEEKKAYDGCNGQQEREQDGFLVPAAMAVRHVLERCASFDATVQYFRCSVKVMSPCYITLAGVRAGEGVVLALSEAGVDKEVWLADVVPPYVVQCNLDAWNPDAEDHQESRERVNLAEDWLSSNIKSAHDSVDHRAMWALLCTEVIWEDHETVYGTVMCAKQRHFLSRTTKPSF
jgi:hypothetical protein